MTTKWIRIRRPLTGAAVAVVALALSGAALASSLIGGNQVPRNGAALNQDGASLDGGPARVTSVDVGRGSYVATASLELNSIGGGGAGEVECALKADGGENVNVFEIDRTGRNGDIVDHATLQLVHKFDRPGTFYVSCGSLSGVSAYATLVVQSVSRVNELDLAHTN